ncbi:MAG: glycosyltransferase [Chloroflexota bacterium]|nr:glycosyltransferase [Chloroflexota bacterium]
MSSLAFDGRINVYDGVDWFWLPTIFRALALLRHERPNILLLELWTGTVLHSYLLLAVLARLQGARVVIEFHEVLDNTPEVRLPSIRAYVEVLSRLLMRLVSGFVVHSSVDRRVVEARYRLGGRPSAIIPHGPYAHYHALPGRAPRRDAPAHCCNLLFFGTIRPYKGLEDLVRAFDAIPESEIDDYWLTVTGEPWEGWTLPLDLIASSRYRGRITLVDRYLPDDEVGSFFAGADAVVLPYRRSSASGPLHIAMSCGLPVVTTGVGGLSEAVGHYGGVIQVPPQDPLALRDALRRARALQGQRFRDVRSWDESAGQYTSLFSTLLGCSAPAREVRQVA